MDYPGEVEFSATRRLEDALSFGVPAFLEVSCHEQSAILFVEFAKRRRWRFVDSHVGGGEGRLYAERAARGDLLGYFDGLFERRVFVRRHLLDGPHS